MAAIRQLLSQTSYDGDGTTLTWNFTFADGYLDRTHVKASKLLKATGLVTQIPITDSNFIGQFQLRIVPAIAIGEELTIYRDTPKDAPLVNFRDRASLTETSLDYNARQCVMVAAEASDGLSTAIQSVAVIANLAQSAERFTGLAEAAALRAANSATDAANSATLSTAQAGAASQAAGVANAASVTARAARDQTLTALAAVANGPVLSVAGRQGSISAAQLRADLNISNVDNTADFQKPVSQPMANALAGKVSQRNSSMDITWAPGSFADGGGLRVSVDQTVFGNLWPISISGRANVAGYADSAGSANTANSAGSATNANYANSSGSSGYANSAGYSNDSGGLGGRGAAGWVQNFTPGNNLSLAWDGFQVVARVDGTVQWTHTEWSRIVNRPSDLAAFSNSPRYVTAQGQFGQVAVAAPDGTQFAGFALPVDANRIGRIGVINGGLYVTADGQAFSWPINPSDERLKEDIRISEEDSLTKIVHMEFKSFRYNAVSPMMYGITRKAGLIAQQLEAIDPDFVTYAGDFRQLNTETLLTAALHAIQKLAKEVFDLKAKQ